MDGDETILIHLPMTSSKSLCTCYAVLPQRVHQQHRCTLPARPHFSLKNPIRMCCSSWLARVLWYIFLPPRSRSARCNNCRHEIFYLCKRCSLQPCLVHGEARKRQPKRPQCSRGDHGQQDLRKNVASLLASHLDDKRLRVKAVVHGTSEYGTALECSLHFYVRGRGNREHESIIRSGMSRM